MSRVAPLHGFVGLNFAGQADPPFEVAFQRICQSAPVAVERLHDDGAAHRCAWRKMLAENTLASLDLPRWDEQPRMWPVMRCEPEGSVFVRGDVKTANRLAHARLDECPAQIVSHAAEQARDLRQPPVGNPRVEVNDAHRRDAGSLRSLHQLFASRYENTLCGSTTCGAREAETALPRAARI